jgi:hypothetical protein
MAPGAEPAACLSLALPPLLLAGDGAGVRCWRLRTGKPGPAPDAAPVPEEEEDEEEDAAPRRSWLLSLPPLADGAPAPAVAAIHALPALHAADGSGALPAALILDAAGRLL